MILDQLLLFLTVQCPHGPWKPLWLTNCIGPFSRRLWQLVYQITKYFIVASLSLCAIIFFRSQVLVNHDNEAFIKSDYLLLFSGKRERTKKVANPKVVVSTTWVLILDDLGLVDLRYCWLSLPFCFKISWNNWNLSFQIHPLLCSMD
jgi:hypothetical protein